MAVAACFSLAAHANPTGPTVVNGNATFQQAGAVLQITNSPSAAINWQGFSIGAGEVTRFIQQSASSAVLNRVITQNPSSILGALQSNGQVFLVNPNGILFGSGAQVDVGGLVASTLDISPADFMAGKTTFSGSSGGAVVNQGRLSAGSGGYVALLGPVVRNEGVIEARMGTVALAAGDQVTLNFGGNSLVGLSVDRGVVGALAENRQLIQADGGRVLLSARAADDVVRAVVNNTGVIEANTVSNVNGLIRLEGLGASTVTSSGTLSARGDEAGANGGTVQMLGERVGLMSGGQIDASGSAGGGTVLVGGDWQGRNPDIQNASRTYVAPDASIKADAILNGAGGKVVVWSDDVTRYYGSISARGGASGGDGGSIEISGKGFLDFSGTVDTSAAIGRFGTLLLDPTNIEVVTTGGTATLVQVDQFADADLTTCASLGGAVCSKIAPATINGAGANVTLQATSSILFTDPISITTAGVGLTATTQTGGIAVNANITTANASVVDAVGNQTPTSGSITLSAGTNVTGSGRLTTGSAQLTGVDASGTDSAASGSISITAGTGGVSGAIGLSNTTALAIGTATRVGASTDTATAGNIILTSRDGIDNGTVLTPLQVSFGAATGAATLNQGSLAINTTTAIGDASAMSAGPLILNTSAVGGNLSLTSAGNISQVGALTVTGTSNFNSAGNLDLSSGSNDFQGAVTLAGRDVRIRDTNVLTLNATGTNVLALDAQANDEIRLSGTYDTSAGVDPGVFLGRQSYSANQIRLMSDTTLRGRQDILLGFTVLGPGALTIEHNGVDPTFTTTAGGTVFLPNGGLGVSPTSLVFDLAGVVNPAGADGALAGLTITSTDALALPGGYVSGNVSVTTSNAAGGNNIYQFGSFVITGTSNFNSAGNLDLSSGSNDFQGAVTLAGRDVRIRDTNVLTLNATGTNVLALDAQANDEIRLSGTYDTSAGVDPGVFLGRQSYSANQIRLMSDTTLRGRQDILLGFTVLGPGALTIEHNGVDPTFTTTAGGTVFLPNGGLGVSPTSLVFDLAGVVNPAGADGALAGLTITSTDALALPGGYVSGNVSVTTSNAAGGNNIYQFGSFVITGTSNFNSAGNLDLSSGSNDFQGAVTLAGRDVRIRDTNVLTLNATGTNVLALDAQANDEIRLSGTYDTSAGVDPGVFLGRQSYSANQIRLMSDTTLRGRQDILLGFTVLGPGALTIEHNGVDPTFTTTAGGTVFLPNGGLGVSPTSLVFDLAGVVNPAGADGALAGLTITSTDALALPGGYVSGNVSVTTSNAAGGNNIYQFGSFVITGTSNFNSAGNLDLSSGSNDFQGAVTLAGRDVRIRDTNVLTLNATGTNVLALDAQANDEIRLSGTYDTSAGVDPGVFLGRQSYSANQIRLMSDTTLRGRQDILLGFTVLGPGALTIEHNGVDPTFTTTAGGTVFLPNGGLGVSPTSLVFDLAGVVNPAGADGALAGLDINSTAALSLPSATSNGSINVITSDNLTILAGSVLSAGATGDALVLAAGGNFINSSGPTALSTPSGRWLVYSTSPGGSTEAGLTALADVTLPRLYNRTYALNAPGTIVAGNHLLYSSQPALSVTANSASRNYGDANPLFTYATSGALVTDDGVTDPGLSGALATAAVPTSAVGPFAITQGTLTSAPGYAITYTGANLTVAQRPVTVTATAGQGKVYGDTDPGAFVFTNTSLGSGVAISGALTRAAGETAGAYAIGQGTLTNGNNLNYLLTYVGANFTVSQRPLTIVADNKSKLQGDPNPPLTAAYSGFAPSESAANLTGLLVLTTPATTGSPAGSYAISPSGQSSGNYAISFVNGTLVVNGVPVVNSPPPVASSGVEEQVRVAIANADQHDDERRDGDHRRGPQSVYHLVDDGIRLPEGEH